MYSTRNFFNMNELTKTILNENDMLVFGESLAQVICSGVVLFLYGPLGAGKTTLVRGILAGLGYQGKVKSPTYTIVEPYSVSDKQIFHFDFYRVADSKELEMIGIYDYFSLSSICLIEWPEHGFPLLPESDISCYIFFAKENAREMRLEAYSERGKEMLRLL